MPPLPEISRDGRPDALEPRGVGDAAVFHGDIEIDAQQYAFALHVDVIEGAETFHANHFPLRHGRAVPAIHVFVPGAKDVDARHKAGHDEIT